MIKRIVFSVLAVVGTMLMSLTIGVTVLNPGTVTGPSTVALSLWPIMLLPALTCIWKRSAARTGRKCAIWTVASTAGVLVYIALEQVGGILLLSGQVDVAFGIGVLSGVAGMAVSEGLSLVALNRATQMQTNAQNAGIRA